MADTGSGAQRPLSPHLQVYKPVITMTMSILHRMTGAGLYVGAILLVWWLLAAASGPSYFDMVNGLYGSLIGRIGLFFCTWGLIHHMLGGLRHFVWDLGHGFELGTANAMAWANIALSVGLTLLVFVIGYMVR